MLSYLDRVLGDSKDRELWHAARGPRLGASDVAKFAKLESVDKYADAKLKPRTFSGNATTENGNRWEPMLLAWAGLEPNSLFIHHPDEEGFGATPDALQPFAQTELLLGEVKTKHNMVITGPTRAELRQVAWQLFVLPEAVAVDWVWGEVVQVNGEWELREGSPKRITFTRTDPVVVETQNHIIPIATAVLAEMRRRTNLKESAGF